jgi:hypothetical protein
VKNQVNYGKPIPGKGKSGVSDKPGKADKPEKPEKPDVSGNSSGALH